MTMVSLVYASRTQELNERVIGDILATARANNEKAGITGALHFSSKYFLQCLEGERSAVNTLYQNIMKDERHTQPVILVYEQIDERRFSRWSMAYVGESVANEHLFFKYSGIAEFNPYQMSGPSSEFLLRELVQAGDA